MAEQQSINVKLSATFTRRNDFLAGRCFYNAQKAARILRKRSIKARYVEGWAVCEDDTPIYHAWLEVDGQIVEPTWSFHPDKGVTRYFPVGMVDSGEICDLADDEVGDPYIEGTFDHGRDYLRLRDAVFVEAGGEF